MTSLLQGQHRWRAFSGIRLLVVGLLTVVAVGGCGLFDDPSPETVVLSLSGDAGQTVEVLMSKQFLTGVNEFGVTQVQLFLGDTLYRALPWDTSVSIAREQRFFVRVLDADSVETQLQMRVTIDNGQEFEKSGVASDAFQFVFTFNQPITNVIEVL